MLIELSIFDIFFDRQIFNIFIHLGILNHTVKIKELDKYLPKGAGKGLFLINCFCLNICHSESRKLV